MWRPPDADGDSRLKAHLTQENQTKVLALAKHKTIREIEVLVARLAPQPDVPTTLRALPNRTTTAPALAAPAPAAAPGSPASAIIAPTPLSH